MVRRKRKVARRKRQKKMNSAQEGISQLCKISQSCEISQVAKIRKPKKFYTAQKTPAFCYSCKTENIKNYKNTYMKVRKITKKDKLKLGKLRKITNKI